MDTKEQLLNNVKEWIKLDKEIAQLKSIVKEKNAKKKELNAGLIEVMKSNNIDCFDVTDGAIIYKKSTIKKPISGKSLLEALQKYYTDNATIAEEIAKHVLDNREEQIKESIRFKR